MPTHFFFFSPDKLSGQRNVAMAVAKWHAGHLLFHKTYSASPAACIQTAGGKGFFAITNDCDFKLSEEGNFTDCDAPNLPGDK